MTASFSKSRLIAWMVWMIASIFYAYQYILRVMPNIILDDIMQQFNITAATFGQFSGVYYIGYSLMHLPLGILLDRYGPRVVMTVCMLLTVLGSLPLIFANHWIYPIAGRVLIGMGSSGAILGLFKIVRMTFSEKRFTGMLSISVTIGVLGAIYGGGPVSYVRDTFGYQEVVKLFAMIGLLLACVTYWVVPSIKNEVKTAVMSDVKEVLGNSRVIWSCIFAGLMVGPLEGFADVWGRAFLKQVYGFDGSLAASLPSLIFIGMCVGAPALSFFAEKIKNYLGVIITCGAIMSACFILFLFFPVATWLLSGSFVLLGICCGYQILAIYKASTYVRGEVVGLTTALANMIIMLFGYAFHTLMGNLINAMGGPNSSLALVYGVAVIPIGLSLGTMGFIFLFLRERKRALNLTVD